MLEKVDTWHNLSDPTIRETRIGKKLGANQRFEALTL